MIHKLRKLQDSKDGPEMIYAFKQVSRETTLASKVNKNNVTHLILAPTDLAEQFSLVVLDERRITSKQNVGYVSEVTVERRQHIHGNNMRNMAANLIYIHLPQPNHNVNLQTPKST